MKLDQVAKQLFLGTPIGRGLIHTRDALALMRCALLSPESVGTLANDQLAAALATGLCRPGKTFIDVGAHIGSIISEVQARDSSIPIVAVEAIPEKAERLRRKFPGVVVHGCAVGEGEAEVSFFINIKRSGYSSLAAGNGPESEVREIRVPMRRLDDLAGPSGVDLIKIDVEGAELGVLRGSVRLIAESRPVIMFESGPEDALGLGFTKPLMWEFFRESDFSLHVPNRVAHDDAGLSLDGFVESHAYPRRTTNYLAIPLERRAEVRTRARSLLRLPQVATS